MSSGLAARLRASIEGPAHRWWALAAIECGHFVVYMDGFIVTMALPTMARHFGVGIHEIKWVLIAYLAALTISLLLAGRLSDRWGRKPVTVAGVALLTLGATLCALAPNLAALIIFRVVQGLGSALVLANVMAEITAVFPKEQRRRAMAVNTSVLAMGQLTGLVLGGFLIGTLGWRSIFLVIVAISGPGLVLDLIVLRNQVAASGRSLDWPGAVLSLLVVGAPFLLIERLAWDLRDALGLAILLGSLILLGLFVVVERRASWPLLDLRLFRSRTYTCGTVSAAFYFIPATFAYFLLPLYGQVVLKLTPFTAGLVLVPLSVALSLSGHLFAPLSHRYSPRLVSTVGLVCTSLAAFGMSFLGPTADYGYLVLVLALVGVGGGLFHPPNSSSVLSAVPPQDLGAANGFFTTARTFGQAVGAALAAALLDYGLKRLGAADVLAQGSHTAAGGSSRDAYVEVQAIAFRIGGALGLVGAVISALRGPEIPHVPPPGKDLPPKLVGSHHA
jgi:EmrB/QacA subfamily drug resistance transporter